MKQFTTLFKNILLLIVIFSGIFTGGGSAQAAGDLKTTGISGGPGGIYVFGDFNQLPASNKRYIFRIATADIDDSAVLVSGEVGARTISTSVGTQRIASATWTPTGSTVAGLTIGDQYYLLISEKNTTSGAVTSIASHPFTYAATMSTSWTEPATSGGGVSTGPGTGGTVADTTFTVTASVLAAGDEATLTMTIVDNDNAVPVIVEYGGSVNLSSAQSQTINLPSNSSTPYVIAGLEPLTTYHFAVRSATATGTYYVQQTSFTTAASGAGYDLSTGGETPTCTDGSDGYCLLAPIGGITVIKDADLENYFGTIYKILIAAAGVLALLMIFWGGVQYMTVDSLMDKSLGKERIKNAIFGLIIALSSYAILNTVNPKLLNFTFGVDKIDIAYDAPDIITFMSGGGAVGVSTIGSNPTTYDALLAQASQRTGLECTLVKAFMMTESGGNPNALSPVGAIGLMQLMPSTATGLGIDPANLYDPAVNIDGGTRLLKQLTTTACNGGMQNSVCTASNIDFVIAAYNGGPGANRKAKRCENQTLWQCIAYPGYQETRNYVPKVKANYNTLKQNNWGC